MYYVGIDIAKYKHDCSIISDSGEIICSNLSFQNDLEGFQELLSVLSSLDHSHQIRIGFESTGHYASNLKLFLEKAHYSFMEFNPVLLSKFNHSKTLRKTKTDAVDASSIAHYLMTVEYKSYTPGFYHMYSLKSLTRLRDSLVRVRSLYLVKITNVLDHTFPEFKPFWKNSFSKTAFYLLNHYGSASKMAAMNAASYDKLHRISRGKFSYKRFIELRELAKNTVGLSNDIFDLELASLLRLFHSINGEINSLEKEIHSLITDLNPPTLSIPGIGPLTAAIIISEFGDIAKFKSPAAMLSFAGLEPSHYQSGISEHKGRMVKRGSSYLRYALMNSCIPLINYNPTFAEYYYKKRREGKTHRVASTHLVKKLLRVIYILELNNITFDPKKIR